MEIIAGTKEMADRIPNVISVDMGFSNTKKSCGIVVCQNERGLLVDDFTYGEMKKYVFHKLHELDGDTALIIEAPLSCRFDEKNDPEGRPFEKEGNKTRYWYHGAGATTALAALKLVWELKNLEIHDSRVILYEGFLSFKKYKNEKHYEDAIYLYRGFKKNDIMDLYANVKSIFETFGIPVNIAPPAIVIPEQNGQ